jgi:hypothetical protein
MASRCVEVATLSGIEIALTLRGRQKSKQHVIRAGKKRFKCNIGVRLSKGLLFNAKISSPELRFTFFRAFQHFYIACNKLPANKNS